MGNLGNPLINKYGSGDQNDDPSSRYYNVCREHFANNREEIYKRFAGSPTMVNLVKEEEKLTKCEGCRENGTIQKVQHDQK